MKTEEINKIAISQLKRIINDIPENYYIMPIHNQSGNIVIYDNNFEQVGYIDIEQEEYLLF